MMNVEAAPTTKTIAYYSATTGYSDAEAERRMSFIRPGLPADITVKFYNAPGPEFFDVGSDFDRAIDAVGKHIGTLAPPDVDAIIFGGALDPGLSAARSAAKADVVGPGESTLFHAAIVGRPTSLVTVDEHAVEVATGFVEGAPVAPPMVSIRSMGMPVRQIVDDLQGGKEALLRACRSAIDDDGAAAIFLGSMSLPTLCDVSELRRELGVPVYDPLRIATEVAIQCIRSRE